MKWNEIIQIVLFFGIGIALTPIVGRFMARVFKGEKTFLQPDPPAAGEDGLPPDAASAPTEEMIVAEIFWVGGAIGHGWVPRGHCRSS